MSGAAELALLLALLEVREVGLRVPAFFLKTLKKKKLVREKGVTLQTDHQNVEKKFKHKGAPAQKPVTYLTGFSRYDIDILVTLLESDSSSEL